MLNLKREMHVKSFASRPKGTCKSVVPSPSSTDLAIKKSNMAAQLVIASHVESAVDNGYTFCASPLYESKPRL